MELLLGVGYILGISFRFLVNYSIYNALLLTKVELERLMLIPFQLLITKLFICFGFLTHLLITKPLVCFTFLPGKQESSSN